MERRPRKRRGPGSAKLRSTRCSAMAPVFRRGNSALPNGMGESTRKKETADFLKHEYGVGGMTWKFLDGTHGSVDYNMYGRPGISVIRGTGMDAPYQLLKWPEAARRIGRLEKTACT